MFSVGNISFLRPAYVMDFRIMVCWPLYALSPRIPGVNGIPWQRW